MATRGIYDFEFTKRFEAAGLTFAPMYSDYRAAHTLARDATAQQLIGTASGFSLQAEEAFLLAVVLTFIERLDVRLSKAEVNTAAMSSRTDLFEVVEQNGKRNDGGGAVIGNDVLKSHKDSRQRIIQLAMQ